MVVFTILSVIGAAAAVILKERANQLHVSCGVLFSAGALIAGAFDMLQEANEQFEYQNIEFQWALTIAGGAVVALSCFEVSMRRFIGHRKITHGFISDEDNPFTAILLSIALSVHSIIEGMGIGASQDVSDLESAFIAMACHKMFVAFALTNGLVSCGYWRKGKRKYFYAGIGTFIFVCVFGTGTGMAIASTGNLIATAVLTAITGGSFIYAAILEVLPEQTKIIDEQKLAILPLVSIFLLGYCLMSLFAVWT